MGAIAYVCTDADYSISRKGGGHFAWTPGALPTAPALPDGFKAPSPGVGCCQTDGPKLSALEGKHVLSYERWQEGHPEPVWEQRDGKGTRCGRLPPGQQGGEARPPLGREQVLRDAGGLPGSPHHSPDRPGPSPPLPQIPNSTAPTAASSPPTSPWTPVVRALAASLTQVQGRRQKACSERQRGRGRGEAPGPGGLRFLANEAAQGTEQGSTRGVTRWLVPLGAPSGEGSRGRDTERGADGPQERCWHITAPCFPTSETRASSTLGLSVPPRVSAGRSRGLPQTAAPGTALPSPRSRSDNGFALRSRGPQAGGAGATAEGDPLKAGPAAGSATAPLGPARPCLLAPLQTPGPPHPGPRPGGRSPEPAGSGGTLARPRR
ncbi:collagen alpha-1(I) chain-like [Hyaena hyaena]|uniref:collagen alpha-1(I) chain-like n=1 Tax=Hyaena hyaena TaxID=95912 RepID=UPI001922F348|nr:collagen alpha-1(I) chain-like [Hyaena hyaena]